MKARPLWRHGIKTRSGDVRGPRQRAASLEPLEQRRLLATFTVDTFADVVDAADGLNSLREAVAAAVATAEDDRIDIPAGTYVLQLGQIEIVDAEGAVTLAGQGGTAVIDADGASRAFLIEFSDVSMSNLRITGGVADNGGGIHASFAVLNVASSSFVGNSAEGDGGGIYANSLLSLEDVIFEENQAGGNGGGLAATFASPFQFDLGAFRNNRAGGDGGGMYLQRAAGSMADIQFTGNFAASEGGAMSLVGATRLSGSSLRVIDNSAGANGGGLFLHGVSRLELSSSVFSRNEAGNDGGAVHAAGFSILDLEGGGIFGNQASRAGGGIGLSSSSRVELVGVQLNDNTAVAGGGIGSLSSLAIARVVGSSVSNNLALLGGGTYGVSIEAAQSTISSNIARFEGGGIHRAGGIDSFVRLDDVTMESNQAQGGRGGAIFAGETVDVDLAFTEVSFNTAAQKGGGIMAGGFDTRVHIESSTISDNAGSAGGGLYFRSSARILEGRLSIQNSTISRNDGGQGLGGGVYVGHYTIFRAANSTISGNRAAGGGGIASEWTNSRVSNLTVTQNEAVIGGGLLTLREPFETGNTIYAGNVASVAGPDVWGDVRSLGGNLVGIRGFGFGWVGSDQLGTAAAPIDPLLGPLANNGGPTLTHLPAESSPAVDAGINSNALDVEGGTLLRDQRGFERIARVRVDVGAVEVGAQAPSLIGGPYEISEGQDLLLDASLLLNPNAQQAFEWFILPGGFTDNPNGLLMATGPTPTVKWDTLKQLGASEPGVYGIRMVLTEDGQQEVFTTTLTVLPA